uniref:Uncharacterized protein n=1 Tax=Caenorhabditis japonica TaxID=281687 RepID=A0A8R1E8N3_CAEJA
MTPGDRVLREVRKEEDRALLKKLYPEMFDEGAAKRPPESPKRTVKSEPVSEDESNEKENVPPDGISRKEVKKEEIPVEKPKDKTKTRSRRILVSSDDDDEDDEAFENCELLFIYETKKTLFHGVQDLKSGRSRANALHWIFRAKFKF